MELKSKRTKTILFRNKKDTGRGDKRKAEKPAQQERLYKKKVYPEPRFLDVKFAPLFHVDLFDEDMEDVKEIANHLSRTFGKYYKWTPGLKLSEKLYNFCQSLDRFGNEWILTKMNEEWVIIFYHEHVTEYGWYAPRLAILKKLKQESRNVKYPVVLESIKNIIKQLEIEFITDSLWLLDWAEERLHDDSWFESDKDRRKFEKELYSYYTGGKIYSYIQELHKPIKMTSEDCAKELKKFKGKYQKLGQALFKMMNILRLGDSLWSYSLSGIGIDYEDTPHQEGLTIDNQFVFAWDYDAVYEIAEDFAESETNSMGVIPMTSYEVANYENRNKFNSEAKVAAINSGLRTSAFPELLDEGMTMLSEAINEILDKK